MDPLCEGKRTFMPASELDLPLDHQVPVISKKTQMNGDHAGGSQCGLSSLLPMSCRGRAAAFARDLHSRLRNLNAAQEPADPAWTHPQPSSRDLETFYDFELECESPSSPVDEFEPPTFPDRSPAEEPESFYDVDAEPANAKTEKPRNGFTFSTAFYTDNSPPVKLQPLPRENGQADKRLYNAMTFEGCARQNSRDEIDTAALPSALERLSLPSLNNISHQDSDSDFESAKSEPSDVELSQSDKRLEVDVTESETLSAPMDCISTEAELSAEEDVISLERVSESLPPEELKLTPLQMYPANNVVIEEFLTSEVSNEKENSPSPEIEPTLLSAESKSDDQDDDDRPQRVRRCSSLKTGKTPPGTPGRKKIVRFADVLGLDLADVKTFMDEIPVIPKSAYDDLTGCDVACSPPVKPPQQRFGTLTLVPLFQIPRNVSEILEQRNVCLESARVADGVHVTVCGSVRVRNLDFHKTVHIRYTMNRWRTYTDLQATYVQGSCDGYSDRFQFLLYAPCISSGQRLELAVRFQCKGQQIWDNNCGANYCFDCLALGATLPQTGAPLGLPAAVSSPLHPTMDWHPSFY